MKKLKRPSFTWKTQHIFKSMLAGMLIAVAGAVFLSCQTMIPDKSIAKVVGSFLFSIGLISVLVLEADLFTGKIGYVDTWSKLGLASIALVFNLIIAFLIGLLYKGINFSIISANGAFPFDSRLAKEWYQLLFDGFICGILIYLAVELYKKTKSFIPVIMCVMAFILSGAEHSIADAFYLGASQLSLVAFGKLGLVIVGNAAGSLITHWLQRGAEYLNELSNNIQR